MLLWKFLWARVGKTASKALGRCNSIAILTVISLVAAFQLLSNNRTPNLFINMKPAETALNKRIRDRPTVISGVFAVPLRGWSVVTANTYL